MKRTALYHYFPNLGAICLCVLDNLQQDIRQYVTHRMAQHRHPIDQLDALLNSAIEFYATRRNELIAFFQLWAISNAGNNDPVTDRERDFLEPQRHFLIALVQNGIERGYIANCDAAGLIDLLLTLVDGAHVHRVTRNPDLSNLTTFFRNHVLNPLRLSPASKDAS